MTIQIFDGEKMTAVERDQVVRQRRRREVDVSQLLREVHDGDRRLRGETDGASLILAGFSADRRTRMATIQNPFARQVTREACAGRSAGQCANLVGTAPFAGFSARFTRRRASLLAAFMNTDAQTRLTTPFVALVVPGAVETAGMTTVQKAFARMGGVLRAYESPRRRHRQRIRCHLLAPMAG